MLISVPTIERLGVRRFLAACAIGTTVLVLACVQSPSVSDVGSWRTGERVEFLGRSSVVMQQTANDCGLAALATLAQRLGVEIDTTVFSAHMPDDSPADMLLLREIATVHGLSLRGVFDRSRAGQFQRPWIAHLRDGKGHFVVVEAADSAQWTIADPAVGRIRVRQEVFRRHWSGNALILDRRP